MSLFQQFNRKFAHRLGSGFLCFLLALPLAAEEAGSIRGQVRTARGEPVLDAIVTVVGTQLRTQVDAQGRFTLGPVSAGSLLLEVESARHANSVERLIVDSGQTTELEIVLSRRSHSERIVVTANPRAQGELDLATGVDVLEGRELVLRLEPTLGESLAQEVGVSSTYFGPGASRPLLRGLGGDRVKVLENSIDVLDASSASPDHAVAADPLAAERIEVVRGPATLLYGSNAIGGVVNVLDERIPRFAPEQSLTGTIDLQSGSTADERSGALGLDGGSDRWAWNLFLASRETDDYEIPGRATVDPDEQDAHDEGGHGEDEHEEEGAVGVLPNSDLHSTSGGVGVSYFFGKRGFLGASVRGLDSEYGLPGGEHGHGEEEGEHEEGELGEDEHGEEGVRINMEQRRYDFAGGVSQPFGAFEKADFRLGIIDYEHVEGEAGGEGTSFLNDAWEARAEFVQRPIGSLAGSVGVQLRSRDFVVVGDEAFVPPAKTESLGIFTFQEFGRGRSRFQFGARYEVQDTRVRGDLLPDRDFQALSASAGWVWRATDDYSLGASLARSVKLPTSEELYSNGPHFAVSAFEVGDPNLGEESALGLDLTLRKVAGRVTGALNLFYNDFSDFVFQRFTRQEREGLPVVQYSQADANFWGAEVEATVRLTDDARSSWDLDFLWDLVRAEFSAGGDLPRIPPQRYGVGFHYRGDRLRAGADARFVSRQERVAENETATDGYTMIGAHVSYRLFFEHAFLDLTLRGSNLTNEDARLHTSFVKDSVPLPGRNIRLTARLGF